MSTDSVPRCALEVSHATLSAWRDGALPLAEAQRIQAHIANCPDCRDVLADYNTIAGKLTAIRVPEPLGGYGHSPRTDLAAHRAHNGRHPIRFAGGLGALAAVLVVALLGAGFFALLHGIPRPGAHPTSTATLSCREPVTTATSPIVRVALTPVPSLPSAEILSALEASPDFQNPVQVAHAPSNSTYGYDPPVLLLPATVGDREGLGYYSLPHYIIVASVNGVRMVLYDVTYNPTTHEITPRSFGYWGPNDLPYGKPYPWFGVSSSASVAALCSAKGLALAASTVPELVFFAPGPQITHTPSDWTGGGYNPLYPVWRLHGTDGKLYFVGIDGKVYTPDQLPIYPGSMIITNE